MKNRNSRTILSHDIYDIKYIVNDEECPLTELFNLYYSGLNDLISQNIREEFLGDYSNRPKSQREELGWKKSEVDKWIEELRDKPGYCIVTYNDKTSENFNIMPRDNFKISGIQKYPNILTLMGERCGLELILREARTPTLKKFKKEDILGSQRIWNKPLKVTKQDALVKLKITNRWGNNRLDINASRQFIGKREDILSEAKIILPGRKNLMHIPEPNLILGLERIYLTGEVPGRITPQIKIVGTSDDRMWYLRTYYNPCVDTGFDPINVGKYFGTLHALGLVEGDRQPIHYVMSGKCMLNYDPDLWSLATSDLFFEDDFKDFKDEIKKREALHDVTYLADSSYKILRERAEHRKDMLRERGITPEYLVQITPKRIIIPNDMPSSIRIENPYEY